MKSLNDIKQDMSELYDQVRDGHTELKTASELANIAGKYLKAEQLNLAREIFTSSKGKYGALDTITRGESLGYEYSPASN